MHVEHRRPGLVGDQGPQGQDLLGAAEHMDQGHDRVKAVCIRAHHHFTPRGGAAQVKGQGVRQMVVPGKGFQGIVQAFPIHQSQDKDPPHPAFGVLHAVSLELLVYRPRIILQKVEGFCSLPLIGGGLG